MSIPLILYIVALILALVEELQSNGKSILGWAVVCICVGLLWGHIG